MTVLGKKKRRNATDLIIEVFLFAFVIVLLYPIYYLYVGSFKSPDIFYDPFAFPKDWYWGSFKIVFERVNVLQGFINTFLVLGFSLVFIVLVGSFAGYALARVNHPLFKGLYYYFLSGMIIPLQATMIILFKLGVDLHLMDTRTFLVILYTAGSIPMSILLYVGFMKSIPREIEEAALIDGAGPIQSFLRIVLPLLMPATGTLLIINVTGIYNDFFTPLLYMRNEARMTLMPQIVQFYSNKFMMDYGPVFALSAIAVLPPILFFAFTQKYMIKGLVAGSLKG